MFCGEKPMATTVLEAEETKKAAHDSGRVLMDWFVRRFGKDAELMNTFIDGGTMGDLYYAKANYLRRNVPGVGRPTRRTAAAVRLFDLGVHADGLRGAIAGCPQLVSAFGVTYDNLGGRPRQQRKRLGLLLEGPRLQVRRGGFRLRAHPL